MPRFIKLTNYDKSEQLAARFTFRCPRHVGKRAARRGWSTRSSGVCCIGGNSQRHGAKMRSTLAVGKGFLYSGKGRGKGKALWVRSRGSTLLIGARCCPGLTVHLYLELERCDPTGASTDKNGNANWMFLQTLNR
jgi:hypothetical protein